MPRLLRQPWMDESTDAFRHQVRRYVSAEMAPHVDAWRRQGFIPREVWKPFGRMGFLMPEMPEAFGGAGVSLAYQYVVQEELTRAEVPATTAVHNICAHYVADCGTEQQRAR